MELLRALAALAESPSPGLERVADALGLGVLPDSASYTNLFVLELQPYASVYLGPEGMLGGEARDRISGFWRALRFPPPSEPDHVATLLACYADLAERESGLDEARARLAAGRARVSFFWEHVVSWLPAWLTAIEQKAPLFYRQWAAMLRDVLREQAQQMGGQEPLSLHLREAPSMADPRQEGAAAFVASLLAPVRSGLVLTRADLRTAASELGTGVRIADRSSALTTLVADQPTKMLGWLAAHAGWWTAEHSRDPVFGLASGFWAGRAELTGSLLRELQREAGELNCFPRS